MKLVIRQYKNQLPPQLKYKPFLSLGSLLKVA